MSIFLVLCSATRMHCETTVNDRSKREECELTFSMTLELNF